MREIKFRAWYHNQLGYDLDLSSSENLNGWCFVSRSLVVERDGWIESFNGTEMGGGILMQFTGLKDKNGKEIYEGDILEFYDDVVGTMDRGQVGWENTRGCYVLLARLSTHGIILKDDLVIGNIYENPELLKTS